MILRAVYNVIMGQIWPTGLEFDTYGLAMLLKFLFCHVCKV